MRLSPLFLGVLALPVTATAQTRVDLTPFIGVYFPLANAVNQNGTQLSQTFSAAFGARLAIWGSKLGVEVGGAFAKSGVSDQFDPPVPGSIALGSFRVLVPLAQGTTSCLMTVGGCQPSVYVSGGFGFIKRGGQAWQGTTGLLNLTGSLGMGVRIPASPKLTVRVDGEVLLYSAQFGSATLGPTSSQFQEDVVLSAGLWIPLAGAR